MKEWIDDRLGRALGVWVETARSRAVLVVAAFAAATAAASVLAVTHLGVNAETEALLSPDLPFRRFEMDFERAFPEFDNDLLIVVDASTAEGARQATEQLADALRGEPELFPNVFVPGGGPFFESHGLLYLDLDELEEFGDQLARAQPFLAELARDPSLRGLFDLLERALEADFELETLDLANVLMRVAESVEAAASDREEPFFFESMLLGEGLAEEGRRRLVVAKPDVDFSEFLPGRRPIDRVYELARQLRLEETSRARVRVTGDLALETEELSTVSSQAALAGLASFLLVSLILLLALGSLRLIVATLVTLLVGLVLTAGFATLAVGHLNLISVAFAVLFIGLAVDFGIHLCLRYRELVAEGASEAGALRGAAESVGSSLVLCAVTTAIGFYAFVPTDYSGVAELGVIAGTGMFISLVCTLTLLPALLILGRRPGPLRGLRASWLRLPHFPVRHPRAVLLVAACLALASTCTLPRLRFDANPLAVRDPGARSVRALRELLAETSMSPWGIDLLARDGPSAEALAQRLARLPGVSRTVTLSDLVPAQQNEKRQLLEEVSFFLALPPEGSERPPPSSGEVETALASLRTRLDQTALQDGDPSLARAAARLSAALGRLVGDPAKVSSRIARLEASLLSPVRTSLRRLEQALEPGPVELDTLPPELLDRFRAEDGRVRVQVYPEADLDDAEALGTFVAEVGRVTPAGVGGAVRIVGSADAIVRALQRALLGALAVIALVLLLLWRRLSDTVLVLTPLLLAALLTCAASVLADIPFNFADVIVLPLLLGMGVDSGIHLVHRHRMGLEQDVLETSTARAVFWSTVTTVASFGSLAFSTHRGMASLGQLLTLGIGFTLVCNLIVLPSLLAQRRSRG